VLANFGVYAKAMIPMGTWIGPYEGKLTIPFAYEGPGDQLWEVSGNIWTAWMSTHSTRMQVDHTNDIHITKYCTFKLLSIENLCHEFFSMKGCHDR
jgi:hypothetical protein